MPGSIRSEAVMNKAGNPGTLFGRVVDAGYEQGRDFQPPAYSAHADEVIQHARQPRPADTAISVFGKSLQIYVGRVDKRRERFKAGRTLIPVADHDASEPCGSCLLGTGARQLEKDGWFGIGKGDAGTTQFPRRPDKSIRRDLCAAPTQGRPLFQISRLKLVLRENGRTGDFTVLTPGAIEIAAESAQREGQAAWKVMVQRLFFNRIGVKGSSTAIYKRKYFRVTVFCRLAAAYAAYAPFSGAEAAKMPAQQALGMFIRQCPPQKGLTAH